MDENRLTFAITCCSFRNKTNLESGASTTGKSPRKQNTTCIVIKFARGSWTDSCASWRKVERNLHDLGDRCNPSAAITYVQAKNATVLLIKCINISTDKHFVITMKSNYFCCVLKSLQITEEWCMVTMSSQALAHVRLFKSKRSGCDDSFVSMCNLFFPVGYCTLQYRWRFFPIQCVYLLIVFLWMTIRYTMHLSRL